MLNELLLLEQIMLNALANFVIAQVLYNAMKKLSSQWTMVHGHFTNVGRIVLKLPGQDSFLL